MIRDIKRNVAVLDGLGQSMSGMCGCPFKGAGCPFKVVDCPFWAESCLFMLTEHPIKAANCRLKIMDSPFKQVDCGHPSEAEDRLSLYVNESSLKAVSHPFKAGAGSGQRDK